MNSNTATTTQQAISAMIDSFEKYLAERANLFDFERSAPVLFEDEIAEVLHSVPDGSEITCYDANETMEHFRIYHYKHSDNVIKCVNLYGHSVPEDEIISTIYEYLEQECGSVYINDTFIADVEV